MPTAAELVDRLTLVVPDFPEPGVLFRDLTPTLADAEALRAITDELVGAFAGGFDLVAGIEARGFLLAAAAAYAAGTGVVAVRKAGKLPPRTLIEHYELEYGSAAIEIRAEQLVPGTRVLVLDDVLATGGTVEATCALLERAGAVVAGVGVVLELAALGGRQRLGGRPVHALRGV
ncbi:adenine phosphoribosyltransferase [Amnibacterium kyonggiense]|uniref:Adenine phosphoribosyltransferase n=1 Tax=Amnibacterium kyonggiense TaxID=595671 RepID=A0A4R7FHJ1_9MICO|nr:adenine phosphoribosyltransferase [Amnibacterium kyonggiense]TDS75694.1 adenine phosphoribosyltransferase [Amnibacterium kyonggiense]